MGKLVGLLLGSVALVVALYVLLVRRIRGPRALERSRLVGASRFGMLVTATAGPDEDLPSIRAEIEGMADSAHIGLRRCYGYQDAAFAGSLGIGIILPEYASTSSKISA